MASVLPPPQCDILSMSQSQALGHCSAIWRSKFDKITVGAAIFLQPAGNEPEVLLLRRKLDESYYPGVFVLPRGKVDDGDRTVEDAIAREVKEESNLDVSKILGLLPQITYITEKTTIDEEGNEQTIQRRAVQVSYIVAVDDVKFMRWNPDEHCDGRWVKESELENLEITIGMKNLAEKAFDWAKSVGTCERG